MEETVSLVAPEFRKESTDKEVDKILKGKKITELVKDYNSETSSIPYNIVVQSLSFQLMSVQTASALSISYWHLKYNKLCSILNMGYILYVLVKM